VSKRKNITVPLLDLKAQYRRIGAEVRKAVHEVLESGQFILGPQVQRFEEEAASHLECDTAIGVASGSDALLLSLMALGIEAGDAVIVPPFTFFSTVSCVTRLGATPLFVDIDPDRFLLDAKKVDALLQERCRLDPDGAGLLDSKSGCRIKVLLPVHLFGRCCSMEPFLALAKKHRLLIVEDVAQALGAQTSLSRRITKAAGTIGDLGCFSFFPTKTLGGMGDGGLITTNQKDLAKKVRMLRVHGQSARYQHEIIGINSRLDSIQAAILRVKLRHLDDWCKERIERARIYQQLFSASGLPQNKLISPPSFEEDRGHVFNYYVIRAQQRDRLKQHLKDHGVQTEVYYPLPLHLQPCFAHLGYRKGDFPHAEQAAQEVLALPMYPELTTKQQEQVVQKITDFYRK